MKKIKIITLVLFMILVSGCKSEEILGEKQKYEGITYQETNQKTDKVML